MSSHFYITGPDGSGKSTYLKEIANELSGQGRIYRHIWIRSPKILSKPLMLYCRLVGLTSYKKIDGIVYGKHEFYKSRFVSAIFPYLQYIDFRLKWFFLKMNVGKNQIFLFDRFNLDTLVDLMVSTRNMDLDQSWVGRKFLDLSYPNTSLVILDVMEEIIRKRKKDTLFDENLGLKIKAYHKLSKEYHIPLINNNGDSTTTRNKIFEHFELFKVQA